jgi:hypothetical protein
VRVSQPFVSSLRPSDNAYQIERKVERGGSVYTMSAGSIGRASPALAPAPAVLEQRYSEEPRGEQFPPPPEPDDYGHWQPDGATVPEAQTAIISRKASTAEPDTQPPTARPLRDLVGISGGELARWVKISTPRDRLAVINKLRMAADILEDELEANREPEEMRA